MHRSLLRSPGRVTGLLAALLSLAMAPAKDGCEPNTYIPSPSRTPLYDGAGEVHLAGYAGTTGFGGEANYAVTGEAGVGAAYWYRKHTTDSGIVERHQAVELMGTWFNRVAPTVRLELSGGIGIGSGGGTSTNENTGTIVLVDGDYIRPFAQGALGFVPVGAAGDGFRFEIAGIARFSYVGFTSFARGGFDVDPAPKALLFEPGLMLRLGVPSVMAGLEVGGASVIGDEPDFNFNNTTLSLGLHVVLNRASDQESPRRR